MERNDHIGPRFQKTPGREQPEPRRQHGKRRRRRKELSSKRRLRYREWQQKETPCRRFCGRENRRGNYGTERNTGGQGPPGGRSTLCSESKNCIQESDSNVETRQDQPGGDGRLHRRGLANTDTLPSRTPFDTRRALRSLSDGTNGGVVKVHGMEATPHSLFGLDRFVFDHRPGGRTERGQHRRPVAESARFQLQRQGSHCCHRGISPGLYHRLDSTRKGEVQHGLSSLFGIPEGDLQGHGKQGTPGGH
mmetsp:Transcript_26756/g.58672  ORF Transcript_26756/g.58672 Transcript_26756/m.58672 type:complete len:249 (+) Transcript_26756:1279-2025(+)